MALKIDIPDTTRGRHMGPAVQTPEGNFGAQVEGVQKIKKAPVTAFGDSSGQMAIANALTKAGNTFFDIAARERAMQEAEDDARMNEMKNAYNNREAEIRLQLEQEQAQQYRDPDQKLEEYTKRLEQAQIDIRGDYQFKTLADKRVEQGFTDITKRRNIEYRAGQIEKDRMLAVKNSYNKSAMTFIDSAARAGAERDVEKLQATMTEINNLTSSPQFIAVHGGVEGASIAKAEYLEKSIRGFVQEMAQANPADARAMVDDFDSVLMGIVGEEQLSVIREDLQTIITREEVEKEQELKKAQTKIYGQLDLGIELGQIGKNDVLRANISDSQKATLIRRIDSQRTGMTKAAEDIHFVDTIIASGGSFAGTGKTHQKAIDSWWASKKELIAQLPPELQGMNVIEQISQVGILPTEVQLQLNGLVRLENDEANVIGANQINALLTNAPYLSDSFTDGTKAFAALIDVGMEPKNARERLQRSSQMTEVERKILKDNAKVHLETVDEDISDWVEDTYDFELWGDTSGTKIPGGMKSDYETLFTSNLMYTQDAEAAKVATQKQMARLWYRTRADGSDRMMKYAPEMEYQMTSEQISGQLQADLEGTGLVEGDYVLAVNPKSLLAGKPNYHVIITKQGAIDVLRDADNTPIVWFPDKQKYTNELLEKGKQERQLKIERNSPRGKLMEELRAAENFEKAMGRPTRRGEELRRKLAELENQ